MRLDPRRTRDAAGIALPEFGCRPLQSAPCSSSRRRCPPAELNTALRYRSGAQWGLPPPLTATMSDTDRSFSAAETAMSANLTRGSPHSELDRPAASLVVRWFIGLLVIVLCLVLLA